MQSIETARNIDTWSELLSKHFVPVEAHNETQNHEIDRNPSRFFSAGIAGRSWGAISLGHLFVNSHSVSRGNAHIEANDPGYLKLNIQRSGRGIVMQDEKEIVLEEGDFVFYDSGRPYTVLFDDQSTTQVVLFPRRFLDLPEESISELLVTPFRQETPLSQTVSSLAQQCGDALLNWREPLARRLTENVINLLGTVIANELSSQQHNVTDRTRKTQRNQVIEFINMNLGFQDLTPQVVAEAHSMSVRTLHQLFEGSGTTVAGMIRQLRLERCRQLLEDPAQDRLSIAALATQWGFADSAHLARSFRQAYGTSPSKWRAAR